MTKIEGYSAEEIESYFEYLDDLRESGATNMFGAAPYLMKAFKLGRDDASAIVVAWMQTFSREITPEQRAKQALAS